jgi:hypothetical protein
MKHKIPDSQIIKDLHFLFGISTFIKIYGLPRSGTNLMQLLIEKNFRRTEVLMILGQKHELIPKKISWTGKGWGWSAKESKELFEKFSTLQLNAVRRAYEKGEIKYLFCIKDPFAWIVSISKFNHLNPSQLTKKQILNYMDEWNIKNENYIDFFFENIDRCFFVNYADLLNAKTTKNLIGHIGKKFALKPRTKMQYAVDAKLKDNVPWVKNYWSMLTREKFDRTFYTKKKYLKLLDGKNIQIIKKKASKKVMEFLQSEHLKI